MAGLLFDVDGVLLDSISAYDQMWRQWAAQRGLDGDHVARVALGRRSEDTVAEVLPGADFASEDILLGQLLEPALQRMPAVAGAHELLAVLPGDRWGCVTSGSREWVTLRLAAVGIAVPRVLVTGEDVATGKPHPEGYLLGAQRLGHAAEDCVAIEDAPAGIAAGKAAGMTVVALRTTHRLDALAAADHVFDDLHHASAFLIERVRQN